MEGLLPSLSVKPSIIAVTETWLKSAQTGFHANLPGYTFLSKPRIYHRGGEVAFYISNNLIYIQRIDLYVINEKVIEVLYSDIKLKEKTITCGVIYCSPFLDAKSHCSFVKSLEESLNITNKKDCFLFGDFNFNLLHPDQQNTSNFINAIFEFGFIPLISKPTKISYCGATLLDQIWTKPSMNHKINTAILENYLSDHLPVMMCMPTQNLKKSVTNLIV